MNKEKLIKTRTALKKWLGDPVNKNDHNEKLKILNKLNDIKLDLRRLAHNERSGTKETPIPKSNNEITGHIDEYRYYSILKRLNDQYIKCNCKFNINDQVITNDDRLGFIKEIIVYSDKVTRGKSGIYVILSMCKADGTKAKKLLRRSRLDNKGFPIEDIGVYKNQPAG
jgi:hypothetical protein